MMPTASRTAGALGSAAVLVMAAGCGVFGGDEEPASDETRLVEMLNESSRLEAELTSAENRIIRDCLEALGHTVHDENELAAWAPEEREELSWGYPHESFLLDPDEAAEYGFGMWAESPEAQESGEADDYWTAQEEKWEEEEGGNAFEEIDNADFEALDPQAQFDWYTAYVGEEKAQEWFGYVLDENYGEDGAIMVDPSGDAGTDDAADTDDIEGELELEGETYEEPKPGGCQLEMIEGLYGEPELVEHTEEYDGQTDTWTEWSFRPENPEYASSTMWEDLELAYTDRMIDLQYEFVDCLAGLGHEGWEFDETGYLPTWEFFASMYLDEERFDLMDSDVEMPPLPEDLPSDYEGKKAYEIQVALDFVECGEELDYVTASTEAYDEVHIDAYSAIEEDTYSWQEDMRDAIARAQDLIDA